VRELRGSARGHHLRARGLDLLQRGLELVPIGVQLISGLPAGALGGDERRLFGGTLRAQAWGLEIDLPPQAAKPARRARKTAP